MPVHAQEHLNIPTKDILSWCYDNRPAFDQEKPIFIDAANPKRSISATQAYTLIRKLIAGFRRSGLQRGDCVCLHSFNNVHYPILVLGIVGAGGVFVGTNPGYTSYELHHALKTSRAKFVITEKELLPALQQPVVDLGIPDNRVFFAGQAGITNQARKHESWRTLLEHGEEDWVRFDDLETARKTTAFLMFSSGTTGLPKAAQLSHYNLVAEHTLVHENPEHPENFAMSRVCALPMFHAAAAPYVHITTLRSGRQSIIMRRFHLDDFLKHHEQHKVTSVMCVPPMVLAMVGHAAASPANAAHVRQSLRFVVHGIAGAAPLDVETQKQFQALLSPDATFAQIWAMTETSCLASVFYHPEGDETGSVGRFMPNLDVKIVDDEDKEIDPPYDRRGELCIRGPTIIRGYLDNSEANNRDWDQDGFFHTGDILYCDSKTKLWYVVDRKKELIKVRGFQVAPNEIEGVLLSHPGIQDVAVIGVDSPDGEVPRAYVVKRDGGLDVTETVVRRWVETRLARYKRLDGGVKFVDAIPKTASGKILKRILRDEAKAEAKRDIAKL
ncbi:hypothetical protein LTR78_007309 [Recurvomyces mirabilis]|uniref:Acetyl-CoA synthetase-like protein n=1 Tax=Recurvomyces mirabilis TaxID=574656 RepID=A0AAE0TSS1_9PEZI|nr:hypothetical protein LTR78_007309 [Recurvomyces mirabilis]KAK5155102.1 hypothetical protein LTS14_006057 [Recurvomyces mirabilis]